MSFIPIRLPLVIEERAKAIRETNVTIAERGGGHEKRNQNWSQPLAAWDVSYGVNTLEQLEQLRAHWYVTDGPWLTWLFKDHSDFKIGDTDLGTRSRIALGDGVTTAFQAVKRYTVDAYAREIEVYKITSPTDRVWLNSVELTRDPGPPASGEYSIDYDTGIITLGDVPQASSTDGEGPLGEDVVYLACEYEWIVRFEKQKAEWVTHHRDLHRIPRIEIRATRLEETFT